MNATSTNLSQLETAGLISLAAIQPELEYMFRHNFFHEAAYASLVKKDRQRLHLLVGEALERLYPDRVDELAPRLAFHFYRSGQPERALPYYIRAGQAAARVYGNAEAVMNYSRALEIALASEQPALEDAQLTQLFLCKGRALELMGRYEEAMKNYQQMETHALAAGNQEMELEALLGRATLHSTPTNQFNVSQGQEVTERALPLARQLRDQAAEARIFWHQLLRSYFDARFDDAARYGEKSLALARNLGVHEQLAYTLTDISNYVYISQGNFSQAQGALKEASDIWRQLNNLPMLADTLTTLSTVHNFLGDFEQALSLTSEAQRISRSIDNSWGQAYSLGLSGLSLVEMGEVTRALTAFEEAYQLANEAGFMGVRAIGPSFVGYLLTTLGAHEKALEYALRGVNNSEEGAFFWRDSALGSLILVQINLGQLEEAHRLLARAMELREGDGYFYVFDIFLALAECELNMATGDYDHVLDLAAVHIGKLRAHGSKTYLTHGLHFKGKALMEQGQFDQAHPVLEEACSIAASIGARLQLWQILTSLARLEIKLGNEQAANEVCTRGKQVVQEILDRIHDPELLAIYQAQPGVRLMLGRGYLASV